MPVVRYIVADVDRAVAFYTGRLGFELAQRWGPAFAVVRADGMELWLSGPQSSAARPMPNGATPEPGGWNRLVLSVADLPALVSRLKSEDVRFRSEIVTGPGGSQALVEDGEGNIVELFEPRAE